MFKYNDIVIDKHSFPFWENNDQVVTPQSTVKKSGNDYDTVLFQGGRGTKKTTDITAYVFANALINNESAIIVRETLITTRNSIFREMTMFAEKHDIKIKKVVENPQPMIQLTNGATFFFRGFDKPHSLKGIKSKVPIGVLWFEEANDIKFTQDEVNEVLDSLRDVEKVKTIYSYNPKNPNHWLKEKSENLEPNERLVVSTIYDNPYLPKQMVDRIEALKGVDEAQYKIRALGQWANLGDVVFSINENNYHDGSEFEYHTISIGVDLGDVNATTFVALGFKNNYQNVDVLENYHYANKENDIKKSWNDYANDFEEFYRNVERKYNYRLITTQVETATGGIGFRQMLLERGIVVKGVKKDKVSDRVMYTNYLLNTGKLRLQKEHRLTEEMINAQRNLNSTGNDYYIIDENDHSINAKQYALGKYIKYMGIFNEMEVNDDKLLLKERV